MRATGLRQNLAAIFSIGAEEFPLHFQTQRNALQRSVDRSMTSYVKAGNVIAALWHKLYITSVQSSSTVVFRRRSRAKRRSLNDLAPPKNDVCLKYTANGEEGLTNCCRGADELRREVAFRRLGKCVYGYLALEPWLPSWD
jgi:hypothetical protein